MLKSCPKLTSFVQASFKFQISILLLRWQIFYICSAEAFSYKYANHQNHQKLIEYSVWKLKIKKEKDNWIVKKQKNEWLLMKINVFFYFFLLILVWYQNLLWYYYAYYYAKSINKSVSAQEE